MPDPEALSLEIPAEYGTMSGPKTLTIGITVNLEHYENLRLEVSGEVQSREDARELARFLYDLLGTYGQDDPATGERIESFRRRVLPPTGDSSEVPHAAGRQGVRAPPAADVEAAAEVPDQSPEVTIPSPGSHAGEEARSPGGAKEGGAGGAFSCEDCGAPVSSAEQKMSMLFASRTLCRKCLKKV